MKILVVAFADSVTTARWVSQFNGSGWDVHLFPSQWPCVVHPALSGVTLEGADLWRQPQMQASVHLARQWPFRHGGYRAQRVIDACNWCQPMRARRLARVIKRIKPDMVHSLEMQHAAYLVDDARKLAGSSFPPWLYSCWGSDIYRFGGQAEHTGRIRSVLSHCGYLFTDCHRDVALARDYGFAGKVLGVVPGGGGIEVEAMRSIGLELPVSGRRRIAVKGYHDENCGGRALHALEALEGLSRELAGYEIVVYSATIPVKQAVARIQQEGRINCRLLPPSPHGEVLRLMGSSRIALAVGLSDGTPNALLEAMAMGAFPVQSDTVSTGEWISSGANGLLVPPDDIAGIRDAVRVALADDALVERAEPMNHNIILSRCDTAIVQPRVIGAYSEVLADARRVSPCSVSQDAI